MIIHRLHTQSDASLYSDYRTSDALDGMNTDIVYLVSAMNTYSSPVRVGVAGATGYAGQELVALLARHPERPARGRHVLVAPIRPPGRCPAWPGSGTARSSRSIRSGWRRDVTSSFLAVPENAAAELAPPLVDAGVRVIDLSGAFRIRDDAARVAVVSGDEVAAGRRGVRPDRALQGRRARRARSSPIPAAIRRRRCWRCCRSPRPACSTPARASSSTRSPASPARAARRAIARTFRRITDRSSAYGIFGHRHVAEMEQELGAAVTFVPHLVPLDRGILETIYVQASRRARRPSRLPTRSTRRTRRAVRAADGRRAAGDQARRVDELLRHRLAARRRHRGGSCIVACLDNLVKGAAGQALQNFNVALRLRRTDGAAVTRPARAQARRRTARIAGEQRARIAALAASLAPHRPLVVVHGGGRAIDAELDRRGIAPKKVDGLRITDARHARRRRLRARRARRTRSWSPRSSAHGVPAVGLTGVDAGLGRATRDDRASRRRRARSSISALSAIRSMPIASLIELLLVQRLRAGHREPRHRATATTGAILNVNADVMACRIAAALGGSDLVIAGGDAGRARRRRASRSRCSTLDGIDAVIASGTATAGMIAKLVGVPHGAARAASRSVRIVDGTASRRGSTASTMRRARRWSLTLEASRRRDRRSDDDDDRRHDVEALESQHVLQTYRRLPVVFERGEGMRLFDEHGRVVSRLPVGHRRRVARPRASGARARARAIRRRR